MARRYEIGGHDPPVDVAGPGDTQAGLWDEHNPSRRHALVIGDPWVSAYAISGTPEQLKAFAARVTAAVEQI